MKTISKPLQTATSKTVQNAFELHDATVAFETTDGIRPVLQDISLAIAQGEWVGIVGKNGSGKSTLAKVLTGVCQLSRGTIQIAVGPPVQMVFQNPEAQIIGETIYEDICFGMENQAVDPVVMPKRVQDVLDQVGLQVPMDRDTSELSGGQKQLLNIASCLALDASILIFDEATAMLDPMARNRILELVKSLHNQGKTIIWITQWMEELAWSGRVVALVDGKVSFDGSNREFFYKKARSEPGMEHNESSPCEALGFALPYAVQVTKQLLEQGVTPEFLPISSEQLCQAVQSLCP